MSTVRGWARVARRAAALTLIASLAGAGLAALAPRPARAAGYT